MSKDKKAKKDQKEKRIKVDKREKRASQEQQDAPALQQALQPRSVSKELKEPQEKKRPKPLCKWDKGEIKDSLDRLKKLVDPPRFICGKCGRVATERGYLCKPVEL